MDYKRIKRDDEEERPLRRTINDLLGENLNVGNYALVSMLTMIAVMFMFQTDIIAFQEAVSGLNPDQITALTIALGGPIHITGPSDTAGYRDAVTAMYHNFAVTMNIPQENIVGMVNEIVGRNTEMQQLLPAGWTFPTVYGDERFASLAELGNRILSHATHPVSQLFSTIITSLRTQLGIPSMGDVITSINENAINYVQDFVQDNPRLEPVRAYYHAVLGIFNGDGNLWEDLQNISVITAFNQYYHIYAGVFVAFFVAVRNTVSITGYVAQGIGRATDGALSFIIGPELYNDIVRQVGDTTRNIVRLPVTSVYYTARFVIAYTNSAVNLVARALIPSNRFDLFMGDPQEIPDNLIVDNLIVGEGSVVEGSYALLNADSSVDYHTLTEIANLLMSLTLGSEDFQRTIEMLRDRTLAQHFSNALQEVLAPEQNIRGDSQSSQDTTSSRASSVSATYGSNPALMARYLSNMISVIFTASAVTHIEDRNVESAVPLITNLTSDVEEDASQSTKKDVKTIKTVIIPDVQNITSVVESRIRDPLEFEYDKVYVVPSPESSQDLDLMEDDASGYDADLSAHHAYETDLSEDDTDLMEDHAEGTSLISNSTRLGGRKRKSRAKKQKGGKRRKTMKKSKKSKLRKPKTLKRRKSHRPRKTRKI